jgi:hypothetical protein
MIKTALLNAGQFADLINAGAAIRAQPNEIVHGFNQSLLGITRASHTDSLLILDVRSTIFSVKMSKFIIFEKLFLTYKVSRG